MVFTIVFTALFTAPLKIGFVSAIRGVARERHFSEWRHARPANREIGVPGFTPFGSRQV
jgi:hypothetical protein